MNELKNELQELQNLEFRDDVQEARLQALPGLIAEAEKTEAEEKSKELKSALAQKDHFREKFEKEEKTRKELEAKLNNNSNVPSKQALDVEDYIDISASLEGLDQREKEYLAQQHKLTGQPLKEIRTNEDFQLWQGAYRQKVEKERALKPSNNTTLEDKPMSFEQRLESAGTMAEKESLLREAGLLKEVRPNASRVNIGSQR